jgi:hypothetical protein
LRSKTTIFLSTRFTNPCLGLLLVLLALFVPLVLLVGQPGSSSLWSTVGYGLDRADLPSSCPKSLVVHSRRSTLTLAFILALTLALTLISLFLLSSHPHLTLTLTHLSLISLSSQSHLAPAHLTLIALSSRSHSSHSHRTLTHLSFISLSSHSHSSKSRLTLISLSLISVSSHVECSSRLECSDMQMLRHNHRVGSTLLQNTVVVIIKTQILQGQLTCV